MKKYIFATVLGLSLIFGTNVSAADLSLEEYGSITVPEIENKKIRIYKGWNLVQGLASREWVTGGIGLGKNNIKAIFALNPFNKKYIRFYPTPEKEKIDEIVSIVYLTFWVYSDKEGTLNYKIAKPEPLKFTWPAGWNIIPVTAEMFDGDPLNGGEFSWNAIKGSCNFEKIYFWNPEDGKNEWVKILPDMKSGDFNDFLGSGMLVKFTNECKLAKAVKHITPPPPLPN